MENKLLSVILLSYQSENNLDHAVSEIRRVMQAEQIPVEIIIIDDGSKDNSFKVAKRLEAQYSEVIAFRLSRNYTSTYAQFAGFSLATGAVAVAVPDDLQRPLEHVVDMYRHWERGHKLILGYRASRSDGWLNDLFSGMYYRLMNTFSDVKFPPGGADGFMADREIIDILNSRIHPINTSITVEALRLGFDPLFLPYDRPPAKEKSRWTFRKKLRLAIDSFLASSSLPIKLITWLGFTLFFLSLILIVLIILAKLFTDNNLFGLPVQGWATTVVVVCFFNGLTMFCVGIVAEYIWRIYEEVKGRPGFIVRREK